VVATVPVPKSFRKERRDIFFFSIKPQNEND